MDAPRPTRSRAYVPVAPKNHEGDVEASPVHLEEQLGGWVRSVRQKFSTLRHSPSDQGARQARCIKAQETCKKRRHRRLGHAVCDGPSPGSVIKHDSVGIGHGPKIAYSTGHAHHGGHGPAAPRVAGSANPPLKPRQQHRGRCRHPARSKSRSRRVWTLPIREVLAKPPCLFP